MKVEPAPTTKLQRINPIPEWLRPWLIGGGVFLLLIVLFYVADDLEGKSDWERYVKTMKARGISLEFQDYVPKPVPDDQNFGKARFFQDVDEGIDALADDLYRKADGMVGGKLSKYPKGRRHYEDLVAWGMAFDLAAKSGSVKGTEFSTGITDLGQRAEAAPKVLNGLAGDSTILWELQEASKRPCAYFSLEKSSPEPVVYGTRELVPLMQICRRLYLRAVAELAAGNTEAALADVKLILSLDRTMKEPPCLMNYRVRLACFETGLVPVWEGLAEHHWDDAQLQELQNLLERIDYLDGFVRSVNVERTFGVRELEYLRTTGLYSRYDTVTLALIPGPPSTGSEWRKIPYNILGVILPGGWYDEDKLSYCLWLDAIMTPAIDVASQRIYPSRLKSVPTPAVAWPIVALLTHQIAIIGFSGDLEGVPAIGATSQTAANQAAIACALERYRLDHGKYPEQLGAIQPKYMAVVPHDVITGQPYIYRLKTNGSFILYSVGWNEKDDGGVPGDSIFDENKGDWVWDYPDN